MTLATDQKGLAGIAVDGESVYWLAGAATDKGVALSRTGESSGRGVLRRTPMDSSAVTTLAEHLVQPRALALDASHVYWVDVGTGTVSRIEKTGGNPEILAPHERKPWDVATDGSYAYWTDRAAGAVRRVPVRGGAVEDFAVNESGASHVVIHGPYVYWTAEGSGRRHGTVVRQHERTRVQEVIAADEDRPREIAVSDDWVAWVSVGEEPSYCYGDVADCTKPSFHIRAVRLAAVSTRGFAPVAELYSPREVSDDGLVADSRSLFVADGADISIVSFVGGARPFWKDVGEESAIATDGCNLYAGSFDGGEIQRRPTAP